MGGRLPVAPRLGTLIAQIGPHPRQCVWIALQHEGDFFALDR